MPDGRYKFPTMNDVEIGFLPLDWRQFLYDGLGSFHGAPVYLNGQPAEITKFEVPPVHFNDFTLNGHPKAKFGFVFKDGHTEYAAIKQINVITGAEPRIEIITEEPPERAPQG